MTRVLARNLHKAVKEVYLPATKTGKTIPILQTVHVSIQGGAIHLHTLELEAWKFHKSTSPARTDNEFDNDIRRAWRQVVTS